ncbi:MAG: amino acid adenylation domain-containing protein, partial [bacterium]|nr:amino acid adenylation domain-containing protein [bacterium]
RNPLFDTMFVFQNMEIQPVELPGLKIIPHEYETGISKFDLTLQCIEIGENLRCSFEYGTSLFKENTVRRFANYFKTLPATILADNKRCLWEIEIIPAEEKKQILFEFNNTYKKYEKGKSITRLFEEQAARTPDNIAAAGISPVIPGNRTVSVTYSRLKHNADQLAVLLRKKGVTVGCIVGLIVERSLEMITGILGILKAGGAYLPIDPQSPAGRIQFMLEDSCAQLVLAEKNLHPGTAAAWDRVNLDEPGLYGEKNAEDANLLPLPKSRDLAYVIFTSGSTGLPKGVMVEHEGISNLKFFHRDKFDVGATDSIVQFAAITFDASVWEIFMALLNGAVLHIAHKEIIGDYRLFEEFLNKNRITIATLPPVYADYLNAGNLESLRLIITAGSSPTIDLVKKWKAKTGYVNAYGPTEVTICATSWSGCEESNEPGTVSIGIPINNTRIYIVDSYMNIQPLGVAGEICISGTGTTRGYLNRPELTRQKFKENPFEPGELLYLTGDLGSRQPDGNIQFLGRIDHQVKIRGYRIELGEIENQLLKHDSIKETVVLAGESAGNTGEKYLCAYVVLSGEINDEFESSGLREFLAVRLPEYMIPAFFVPIERIPLTSSGKADRKSLPVPEVKAVAAYTAPRDIVEETLTGIWAGILGIEKCSMGIDANFFQLGGHSLKATLVISQIHKRLNKRIPLLEMFKTPTIRGLASRIKRMDEQQYAGITPAEQKDFYVLSPAQKRLYILHRMEEEVTSYNLPAVFVLEGKPDKERFEITFKQLIVRHESLRTSFGMRDGEPAQKIHHAGAVEFEIAYYPAAPYPRDYLPLISQFIRPFDLSHAPLFRVGLIKVEDMKHIVMYDMHHIIADGMSLAIFAREFMALYPGEELPSLKLRYRDYAEWLNSDDQRKFVRGREEFWLKQFAGDIPVLELPIDYTRPGIQAFEGKSVIFEISGKETAALKELAFREGATLFMILLALYNVFLAKLSGREDIVVGTPTAGRRHADLEPVIGMFVNTLGLRNYPEGEKPFNVFLRVLKARTLEAFENQDYPFEDLVNRVGVDRDTGRSPLFDVMFILQNMDIAEVEIPGLKLIPFAYENRTSRFDLTLEGTESNGGVTFKFEYSTKLFKDSTIVRFIDYFKQLTASVLH